MVWIRAGWAANPGGLVLTFEPLVKGFAGGRSRPCESSSQPFLEPFFGAGAGALAAADAAIAAAR